MGCDSAMGRDSASVIEMTSEMIEAGETALTENVGYLLSDPNPRVCYETVRSILHAALGHRDK